MNKSLILAAAVALALTACGQQKPAAPATAAAPAPQPRPAPDTGPGGPKRRLRRANPADGRRGTAPAAEPTKDAAPKK